MSYFIFHVKKSHIWVIFPQKVCFWGKITQMCNFFTLPIEEKAPPAKVQHKTNGNWLLRIWTCILHTVQWIWLFIVSSSLIAERLNVQKLKPSLKKTIFTEHFFLWSGCLNPFKSNSLRMNCRERVSGYESDIFPVSIYKENSIYICEKVTGKG